MHAMLIRFTAALAATAFGGYASVFSIEGEDSLMDYQSKCTHLFAELVTHVPTLGLGYSLVLKEAYRPKVTALEYARLKIGIADSLHTKSLAYDIALRVNGKYTTDYKDHEPIGLVWEEMGRVAKIPTAWGGRFNDAVHFSCAYEGRK